MILGTPFWLWILLAISIPVAIHLWNKKSGKPHLLGTFRFLPDESFAKATRIELHEIPLLILRTLIVLIITLLLAQLFIISEKESTETIHIVEEGLGTEVNPQAHNAFELQFSSSEIDQIGWWKLIEQAEHDYRPGSIIITGSAESHRFKGTKPEIFAHVNWNTESLSAQRAEAIWKTNNDNLSAYIHERNDNGISSQIRPVTDLQREPNNRGILFGDTLQIFEPIRLVINSEMESRISEGLDFFAESWNLSLNREVLDDEIIATVYTGGNRFDFFNHKAENRRTETLPANPITGISFQISQADTVPRPANLLLESLNNIPVLWIDSNQNLHLNGEVTPDLQSWIFAAAGHQWLKNILGIENRFQPEMTREQRMVKTLSEPLSAGMMEKRSARSILLILLVLLWGAERFTASKRGM